MSPENQDHNRSMQEVIKGVAKGDPRDLEEEPHLKEVESTGLWEVRKGGALANAQGSSTR